MQMFANIKQHYHSFMEFYVIHLKIKGKNLITVSLKIIFSLRNVKLAPNFRRHHLKK